MLAESPFLLGSTLEADKELGLSLKRPDAGNIEWQRRGTTEDEMHFVSTNGHGWAPQKARWWGGRKEVHKLQIVSPRSSDSIRNWNAYVKSSPVVSNHRETCGLVAHQAFSVYGSSMVILASYYASTVTSLTCSIEEVSMCPTS